ncbi:hypothetical protein [Saccharopolyspora pogona]|uniref:hypothetical protein n=1 Tax=Saccharopolyspora pogona TaxID=333966 RepID=UPI00168511E3|nr:hypothetical protein [Saccharopolyspora pogona]
MAGDFSERIRELAERVGDGDLQGRLVIDQIYARRQHEELTWRHPRGGQAKYLEQPLHTEHRRYLQNIADAVLDERGPAPAMAEAMEDLSRQVEVHAPIEYSNLRESGHPMVKDDGRTVYDRPPKQRRLTEQELKEQRRHGQRHRHLHPEQYED